MPNKTRSLLLKDNIILDLPAVLLICVTSVTQNWPVSEWQGQKAFLNLPSCFHRCQGISGLCLASRRQARGAWNQPQFPLPPLPVPLSYPGLAFWGPGGASEACPGPSASSAHGQPLDRSTSQAAKHLVSLPHTELLADFPSRKHFGGIFLSFS